jgi:hypothetical protein
MGGRNKYSVREIKDGGKLRAAIILTDEERDELSKEERIERFRKWHDAEKNI